MKKINDENIKEALKKCNPYQIKTSSTQILEAYNRAKEEKTNNRKAKNIIILAPLILCSSLILVFTMYGIKKSNTKNSFDYSKNKLVSPTLNRGTDGYVYFCAINPTNNTVVPVFKMYASVSINRKEVDQKLVLLMKKLKCMYITKHLMIHMFVKVII